MRSRLIRKGTRLCLGVRSVSSACGILVQASALGNSSATPTIFVRFLYQKIRDVCVVVYLSLICLISPLQLLTASADGMSASHVKVKISLMTGQPRSSSGLSPRSAAYTHLHTIPTLSGRFTRPIRLLRHSTPVTSLALSPRSMSRAVHKCPRESVRLFARMWHRQRKA
jgi:hypothetical protein